MSDDLARWVGMVRDHEKHTPECFELIGPVRVANVPGLFHLSCSCDQPERADARLAWVLLDAFPAGQWCYATHGHAYMIERALAVVERAAQEGPE